MKDSLQNLVNIIKAIQLHKKLNVKHVIPSKTAPNLPQTSSSKKKNPVASMYFYSCI